MATTPTITFPPPLYLISSLDCTMSLKGDGMSLRKLKIAIPTKRKGGFRRLCVLMFLAEQTLLPL